ncbi:Metallo-dependent phosphatase [Marasmius fiardii PR-910]|nr:Metallo-dependent phosphatase [Marasmius fiardii PR-910]
MDTTQNLTILHFNDVYRVSPQKLSSSSSETIDVSQFSVKLDNIRDQWPTRPDGKKDGLTLFSGDLFSPSVESSVTRGSHMVPVINHLAPDVSLTGNHDFDFGFPHLTKLVQDTTFPWLLSNIVDTETSKVPESLHEFQVIERAGITIGVIGLVEEEWIATVSSWPENFKYMGMKETGQQLSKLLRDPEGPYKCDAIFALTHCRLPNDIKLAKDLLALSPTAQDATPIVDTHGVDILLGGHDHMYYVPKGVDSWEGHDNSKTPLGSEGDSGDVLVVKSGMDFRNLSEFTLSFASTPEGSIRKKVIKSISGRRHDTKPGDPSSEELSKLLKDLLSSVSSSLKAPICRSNVAMNLRSSYIRTEESAGANWFADTIRHAYDDVLCVKGCGGADAVFICAGTLRGDSEYGPGNITLGDVLEILPFDDPIVVLEVDGAIIWDALEASLETWPAQEGRFPVISGMRVSWDSRREKGQRVLGVWFTKELEESIHGDSGHSTPRVVDGEPIQRSDSSRKYKVITREYMAQGHDGFTALKRGTYLVDDESGQPMSTLVRKYLLGSHFVRKMAMISNHSDTQHLKESTQTAIQRERTRNEHHHHSAATEKWKHAASLALRQIRSRTHYQEQFQVCTSEHMSSVDPFNGKAVRTGGRTNEDPTVHDESLLVVEPRTDGRLKDLGRE